MISKIGWKDFFIRIPKIKMKKENMIPQAVFLAVFFMLSFFIVYCEERPDYFVYERIYNGVYPDHEWGYMFLNNLFWNTGFRFQQFLAVISFFALLFTLRFLYFSCYAKLLILVTYLWFPFFSDGVQIRSLLANTILYISFGYLFQKGKKGVCQYILCVFLAGSMHYYALIYIILLAAKVPFHKRQLLGSCMILSVTGIFLFKYTGFVPVIIEKIFGTGKVLKNFQFETEIGFVIPAAVQFIQFWLFLQAYGWNKKIQGQDNGMAKIIPMMKQSSADILLRANIWMMLALFPLYVFNVAFFRVYRCMHIVNIIFIFNTLYVKQKGKLLLTKNSIFLLFYILLAGVVNGSIGIIRVWIAGIM